MRTEQVLPADQCFEGGGGCMLRGRALNKDLKFIAEPFSQQGSASTFSNLPAFSARSIFMQRGSALLILAWMTHPQKKCRGRTNKRTWAYIYAGLRIAWPLPTTRRIFWSPKHLVHFDQANDDQQDNDGGEDMLMRSMITLTTGT